MLREYRSETCALLRGCNERIGGAALEPQDVP